MEPHDKLKESLINEFDSENLCFRLFIHNNESNPMVAETQLRMEMTSISPLGVVVYSRNSGDYQKNIKKILTQKIERLYQNANMTLVDAHPSEIHEDRLINEDQSYDDVNGYEPVTRPHQVSRFTAKYGILLII